MYVEKQYTNSTQTVHKQYTKRKHRTQNRQQNTLNKRTNIKKYVEKHKGIN
jgi:hypothetical protein